MKCPNHLCEHRIEGSDVTTCPRCSVPLPGAVLADRFSLEKLARVTPYSLTFVAFDRERTLEAQVRVYIPRFGHGAAALKSEIKALKEMHFEGLPRILGFNWDADFPWVAEDKIVGSSMIGRLVGRDRPLAEPELIGVLLEAARILEKLHTLHIYHRDIRPESLYNRETDNRLMLGTPGWEREFHDKTKSKNRTIYSAPETGGGRATAQADLYSLGVSALHLLTGLHPEGMYNASTRTFQWQRAVKVSPRLAEILDGLVAAAPGDRIQTAGRLVQLLQALDREHGGADGRVPPEDDLEAARKAGAPASAPPPSPGKAPQVAGAAAAAATGVVAGAAGAIAATAGARNGAAAAEARTAANASWGGLRKGETAEAGPREKRLKRIVAAMAAALAALLGVVVALLRRFWESSLGHALGAHGGKVLVALGIASGAAVVSEQLKGKPQPAGNQAAAIAAPADRAGLPAPVVGFDDQAVPTDPDFQAIAQAEGPLPDPALLGKWLKQQIAAQERAMAASRAAREREAQEREAQERGGSANGAGSASGTGGGSWVGGGSAARGGSAAGGGSWVGGGAQSSRVGVPADPQHLAGTAPTGLSRSPVAPDGFAFSDGTRNEVSRMLSLYSSIFPWQGKQMALGSAQRGNPQLSEVSAAQLLAAQAGLPPSLAALDTSRQAAAQVARPQTTQAAPLAGPAAAAASRAATDARAALASAAGAMVAMVPPDGSDTGTGTGPEADREPGQEPAGERASGKKGRSGQGLAPGSPYDTAAEPGYDPSDSSGLSQPVSPYFIRVNKTYRTLTLYREGQFAAQYPITIGKGPTTPDGRFTIANKVVKPPYESIPGGDPRNPFGNYWLGLDVSYPGGKSIGLHGTNAPSSLGQAESGGCIRLRNEDVQRIYELVPTGTPVEII